MESQNVQKIVIGALSLAAFAVLWELLAIYVNNSFFLPRFSSVFSAFLSIIQTSVFFTDVAISLYHFSIGFLFALLVGVPVGMMMGWFPFLDKTFSPIVEIFRPIPPLAWIP
ncbi:MAG: ABC transporter permease, partial [Methanosarcinales archaeon]|nr:ABC transporter permease [Methanosarcinales archaeon]